MPRDERSYSNNLSQLASSSHKSSYSYLQVLGTKNFWYILSFITLSLISVNFLSIPRFY